jgi:hypothetical protein
MSLPIPNLDDKRWAQLVEEARQLIPSLTSDWTDHNIHDPGITFLELFAWLAEMQIYRVNRIGDRHREVFAKLAGEKRRSRQPARMSIWPPSERKLEESVFLPAETQLVPVGRDEIIFETKRDLNLTRSKIKEIITQVGASQIKQIPANKEKDVYFFPFGEAAPIDAELRIALDRLYPNEERNLRLTFELFTADLPRKENELDIVPVTAAIVRLAWEYRTNGGWQALMVENDTTHNLLQSGYLEFEIPTGADGSPVWIRARVAEGRYTVEPRVLAIGVNVLSCVQRETVRDELLGLGTGGTNQTFELHKGPFLPYQDDLERPLMVTEVIDWDRLARRLAQARTPLERKLRTAFEPLLQTVRENKKLTALHKYDSVRRLNRELDKPLPEDEAPMSQKVTRSRNWKWVEQTYGDLFARSGLVIEVGEERWQRVDHFDESGPEDEHYVFERESGKVTFGNGLNGRRPASGQPVWARVYRTSEGRDGNVKAGLSWKFKQGEVLGVYGTNRVPATGGEEEEPLEELAFRVKEGLRAPSRAITSEDFEKLALTTPGAQIARAKALPGYLPEMAHLAERKDKESLPGVITVVIVSHVRPGSSALPRPEPEGVLQVVRDHLAASRLVGDEIHVVGPEYVEIRVDCSLHAVKGVGIDAVRQRAEEKLRDFLSPRSPNPWPFGRFVFPSEIYQVLDGVEGVDSVSAIVLKTSGRGRLRNDVIEIPKTGLVYPGKHDLKVIPHERSPR